jgi:hypothetical protein
VTNTAWRGTEEPPARIIAGMPDFRLSVGHACGAVRCGIMWFTIVLTVVEAIQAEDTRGCVCAHSTQYA